MNTIITAPFRRRYYLVFDVETTGLLPKTKFSKNGTSPSIDQYPYILQLSFAIYDLETRTIIQKYDSYIKIANSVEISEYVVNLTGINKEICQNRGKPICSVLYDFYKAYTTCQGLVGHNLEFDTKMILVELERNRTNLIEMGLADCFVLFQPMHEKINNIDRYCTMRKGTALCNILFEPDTVTVPATNVVTSTATNMVTVPATNGLSQILANAQKSTKRKFPKLSELYQKLFGGEIPPNLHNSMVDVEICLQCYLKMRHNISP